MTLVPIAMARKGIAKNFSNDAVRRQSNIYAAVAAAKGYWSRVAAAAAAAAAAAVAAVAVAV